MYPHTNGRIYSTFIPSCPYNHNEISVLVQITLGIYAILFFPALDRFSCRKSTPAVQDEGPLKVQNSTSGMLHCLHLMK